MMFKRLQPYFLLGFIAAFSLGVYLLTSNFIFGIGFPLDDAWIHQTYARNLAHLGEWSFIAGQPSAGSTAPFWSGLLAVGFLFNNAAIGWTFFLGWACLYATALAGSWMFRLLSPEQGKYAFWVAVFLLFEWHLVWAAGSGMETLLFALLVLLVLAWLINSKKNWFGIGLLIGLSLWIRPDGITFIGPAAFTLFFVETTWKKRVTASLLLILGILALVLPYLALNNFLSGTIWPNTFFAKQAEYAIHKQLPLGRRFATQFSLLLIGAGALLLPGFGITLYRASQKRAAAPLAGIIWLLGYILMYAVRLPVTYQHGRYIIPAMPVYFIFSLAGMLAWLKLNSSDFWRRVVSRVWVLTVSVVLLVFWLLGARAYALDVAVIETEMVATAKWVSENLEPVALVAAHDIGALGYFGGHQILDLAGLVSPEVIPFIRDELALENYLNSQQVDYLITFPDWYPYLVQKAQMIYNTDGVYSTRLGAENMAVFRWNSP